MSADTLEDRQTIWRMHYAIQAFKLAKEAADYISDHQLKYGTPLYYPLFTAIAINYARPFKRSNLIGKLPMEMIPEQHTQLHSTLIVMRDTLFAHSDGDGVRDQWGPIYEVRYSLADGKLSSLYSEPQGDTFDFAAVSVLCQILIQKAEYHLHKLEKKHSTSFPSNNGEYLLNLNPAVDEFFLPATALQADVVSDP